MFYPFTHSRSLTYCWTLKCVALLSQGQVCVNLKAVAQNENAVLSKPFYFFWVKHRVGAQFKNFQLLEVGVGVVSAEAQTPAMLVICKTTLLWDQHLPASGWDGSCGEAPMWRIHHFVVGAEINGAEESLLLLDKSLTQVREIKLPAASEWGSWWASCCRAVVSCMISSHLQESFTFALWLILVYLENCSISRYSQRTLENNHRSPGDFLNFERHHHT